MLCFSFLLSLGNFLISHFLCLSSSGLGAFCLASMYLWFSTFFFLVSNFIPCSWKRCVIWFLSLLGLVLCASVWSVVKNAPCVLEKNVYSIDLDRMFCMYLLSLYGIMFHLRPPFHDDIWSEWSVHCCKWGVKFPAIIVLLLVSPFISVNNCLIYGGCYVRWYI